MGDVNIIIKKNGKIVDVDAEDDDNVDNFSGSGDGGGYEVSTPDVPIFTPTSNRTVQNQKSAPAATTDLIPYIVAGVVGVFLLIVITTLIVCIRKRKREKSKKSDPGAVMYVPNSSGQRGCGEGYDVAISLTAQDMPLEEAPPPPVPASNPPLLSPSSSMSSSSARYTPLGGRKGLEASAPAPDDEKNSIYESIDEADVANVYEEAKPPLPRTNSGRDRILSSVTEDPNMGSEEEKMLPPSKSKEVEC